MSREYVTWEVTTFPCTRWLKNIIMRTEPCLERIAKLGYIEQKILVLDDDFDLSNLVKNILQRDGFKNVFAFTESIVGIRTF